MNSCYLSLNCINTFSDLKRFSGLHYRTKLNTDVKFKEKMALPTTEGLPTINVTHTLLVLFNSLVKTPSHYFSLPLLTLLLPLWLSLLLLLLTLFLFLPLDLSVRYQLYAISNHSGSCYGGHYTAYCKHSVQEKWYCFNDSRLVDSLMIYSNSM